MESLRRLGKPRQYRAMIEDDPAASITEGGLLKGRRQALWFLGQGNYSTTNG